MDNKKLECKISFEFLKLLEGLRAYIDKLHGYDFVKKALRNYQSDGFASFVRTWHLMNL